MAVTLLSSAHACKYLSNHPPNPICQISLIILSLIKPDEKIYCLIVAVDCKRYTVKQIEISGNQTGNMSEIFRTTKDTQRYDKDSEDGNVPVTRDEFKLEINQNHQRYKFLILRSSKDTAFCSQVFIVNTIFCFQVFRRLQA